MVQLFGTLMKSVAKLPREHFRSKFLDSLRLTLHGGHGGNGLPKLGGVGGQGGCVYFQAKKDVTLRKVAQKLRDQRISASSGADSSKICLLGHRGSDVCIEVPVGVQILDERGRVLSDLNEPDAKCIVAEGGIGGSAHTNFIGKPGAKTTVRLNLKLIADIGLVGFPNAGKSTLLKAISNAKPKIASYPFTTIKPQVGTIEYNDFRSITMADLPGLIEGAHINYGMGHSFLKHIERTRLLLIVVDINGFRLRNNFVERNCLETIFALNKELELYDASMLDKPIVLVINKTDVKGAHKKLQEYLPAFENLERHLHLCPPELKPTKIIKPEQVIPMSVINSDTQNLKNMLRHVLDDVAARKQLPDENTIRTLLKNKVMEIGPKIT